MNKKVVGLTVIVLFLVSLFAALQQWSEERSWINEAKAHPQSKTVTFKPLANQKAEDYQYVPTFEDWEAEFINEKDTVFSTLGGNLYLNIKQIWVRDSCIRDTNTSRWYINNQDTVFFRNLTHVKLFKNDTLVYNQKWGYDLFADKIPTEWQSLYRFGAIQSVIFNKRYGHVYINQTLELPQSKDQLSAFVALNENGLMLSHDVNAICDGGLSLTGDEEHLLTCSEIIKVQNLTKRTLTHDKKIIHASLISDTVYVTVSEATRYSSNLDDLINTNICHVNGDTLFSFIYANGSMDQNPVLPIGKWGNGKITVFYDPSIGEVVTFKSDDWFNPEYYSLDELVALDYSPADAIEIMIPKTGIRFVFNRRMKLIGYLTNQTSI